MINSLSQHFIIFCPLKKALLLYFPSQIDFLIEYYLLHQHCQLFHNHLLISRGWSRVIIAPRKHLIPPLWSKYADKKLSPTNVRISSHGKRLNRKNLISGNLGRKIMTPHSSTRLNFSFNPRDYPAKSLFMKFSSFSDPRNQQVSLSDV